MSVAAATLVNVALLAMLFVVQAIARIYWQGLWLAVSNLDTNRPPPAEARLQRVARNQLEAVVLWGVVGALSPTEVTTAAVVFVAARLAYVPLALRGVAVARSAVWFVGLLAWSAQAGSSMLATVFP